jgi:hypothetical protein
VLWGVGLMAGATLATVAAAALASVLACSPNAAVVPGPVAAKPAPGTLDAGPPPPTGGLAMPTLALDWSPPSAAAGDLDALAAALARHPRVGLFVDGDGGPIRVDAMRLAALIGRLAPGTAVHPIANSSASGLAEVLREDPPLLPTTDGGRTRWALPERLELDTERLRSWAEQGDDAVLVVGAVEVAAGTWRQLSSASVGSCEPLLGALLEGQAQSLALLEPFLDHADSVLASLYAAELASVVPQLQAELAEFEQERPRKDFDLVGWERYQCGRRYLQYLQPFVWCASAGADASFAGRAPGSGRGRSTETSCASTPRVFLRGSVRIGSVEPSDYVPSDCPRRLDRDYIEALREPARAAAEHAADHLDARWLMLAERLATLAELHGALTQLCTPARRRFAVADLDALRSSIAELGPLFTREDTPAHDARFLTNDGNFHVPGLGKVRLLAQYDGGTGSASRELLAAAKKLATFERAHAQCVARPGDAPLMAMLIDTRTATPEFIGFYYAEELWCEELGPLE